jgi:hypothetical protein
VRRSLDPLEDLVGLDRKLKDLDKRLKTRSRGDRHHPDRHQGRRDRDRRDEGLLRCARLGAC